ncbi:MAG TPA: D-glycerate dehydrogenase, partial [Candidatus Methylomirabilis sp.]|nr:D-glycerate dehydrogenase [Candidatus Methylomirabilis sp.]
MKPKVLITRMLPQPALDIVFTHCDVDLNRRDVRYTKQQLLRRLKRKAGMICLLTDAIDAAVLRSNPHLKVVSNVAVGIDNIDLRAATKHGIMVTNTPGVLTETTAEFAWALLMAAARRVVEGDRFVRAGKWKEWMLMGFLGRDLFGKTLGICGLGRIGSAVARRARGFNMRIAYTQRHRNEAKERELDATYVDKTTLLKESDFVVLVLPLTPETRHYIGPKELKGMKATAILVNVARGPIVDEKALVHALKTKTIAGAGLDVFEREPKVQRGLLRLPNVVLAPHIASASMETRTRMACMA